NIVRLGVWKDPNYPRKGPESSFAFFSWPKSASIPIELEFLGAGGKALESAGGGSSDQLTTAAVRARANEVKRIRLKFFPNVHRLVFTIPELPGLPEENRNMENLFDVHIPYSCFRYESAFQID